MDHLSGELAILKRYLKSKHAPEDVLDEIDSLCKVVEKAWDATVAKISKLLEDEQ